MDSTSSNPGGWDIWCAESKAHFRISVHEGAGKQRKSELVTLGCPVCDGALGSRRIASSTEFNERHQLSRDLTGRFSREDIEVRRNSKGELVVGPEDFR